MDFASANEIHYTNLDPETTPSKSDLSKDQKNKPSLYRYISPPHGIPPSGPGCSTSSPLVQAASGLSVTSWPNGLWLFLWEKERFEKQHIEEVNRAKLVFFTNVSHEFRTPYPYHQSSGCLASGTAPSTIIQQAAEDQTKHPIHD